MWWQGWGKESSQLLTFQRHFLSHLPGDQPWELREMSPVQGHYTREGRYLLAAPKSSPNAGLRGEVFVKKHYMEKALGVNKPGAVLSRVVTHFRAAGSS